MTKVIAHAGCENTAPNSRENIETALKLGADIIEIDIRLADGKPYLSHEPVCNDNIHQCLTFQHAIEMIRDSQAEINCDLKESDAFLPVIKILRDMKMEHRTFFSGENFYYDTTAAPQFRRFINVENLGIVASGEMLSPRKTELLIHYYLTHKSKVLAGFNINYQTINDNIRDQFHQAKIPLAFWTVNDEQAVCELLRAKIDYLSTNIVEYVIKQKNFI